MAVPDVVKDSITKDGVKVEIDTAKVPTVGADSDAHGCKSSTGYTWSELKQKCIRIFEEGTKLSPYDSENQPAGMAAFVIFEENGNKAELFVPNQKSIILKRKSEGGQYVNGDWQLIPWKGYVLKKGKDILYTGQ
ncbi:hypothetical protein SAMN04487935_2325 [Flavobacterium noncentrifugens]|uniref:Uncharacterized protein n=2 Tax=Flavobacterium noncentrifugens TaxID=1128970 RepID=A0A1G8YGK5_9FLAO|nr:hypothetical protein SAMN04487935_2325 [Flavobacterium noncentrifugens]